MTAAEAEADAPLRRRRGEALEDAICAAALDELRGSGYSGFTFDAVAARAHTGKASIYRRWSDKRQLVMDAICRSMPRPHGTTLADELPDSVTTRDALLLMFESMVVGMSSVSTDALRCIVTEATRNPGLAEMLNQSLVCPRQGGLIALLERGVRLGDVRADVPFDLVVQLVPGFMIQRIMFRGEPLMDASLARQLVDEVLMPVVAVRPAPVESSVH
jgi:AcrR family transcriptional regulator